MLNQNQPQNSSLQEAKKLEHSNSDDIHQRDYMNDSLKKHSSSAKK